MIVLLIGDVVGESGLQILEKELPHLIKSRKADFVIVNGENAAAGYGITASDYRRILAAGADAVTSGNHVWEKEDFLPLLNEPQALRPANYPPAAPGHGWTILEKKENRLLVLNLQGREYMTALDCPFRTADAVLEAHPGLPSVIDFHAESAREKEALAFYLDGRVNAIAGTHTHVQTADERLLPKGSAYITDLGMTGPADSVIGMDENVCIDRAKSQILYKMKCAESPPVIQGAVIELDGQRAVSIKAIAITSP